MVVLEGIGGGGGCVEGCVRGCLRGCSSLHAGLLVYM